MTLVAELFDVLMYANDVLKKLQCWTTCSCIALVGRFYYQHNYMCVHVCVHVCMLCSCVFHRIFAALVAYFVVGAVIMYNNGTRGIEMIPNIGFWKDLPFLIKVKHGLRCTLIRISVLFLFPWYIVLLLE